MAFSLKGSVHGIRVMENLDSDALHNLNVACRGLSMPLRERSSWASAARARVAMDRSWKRILIKGGRGVDGKCSREKVTRQRKSGDSAQERW